MLFRIHKGPLQTPDPGEQQSADLDQEAEVNGAGMAPGSPGGGLKREGSRWGNPPLQDIRTVGDSRCSPPHTKAICRGWLTPLGQPCKALGRLFLLEAGPKEQRYHCYKVFVAETWRHYSDKELSLLLERDELPFFLPILTFSLERSLQTTLCCLLQPDWMWLILLPSGE